MDEMQQIQAFSRQGYTCSQILLLLAMDQAGKSNPGVIRAVGGLAGGLGFSGELCGALSGGACLLGLYTGKGADGEEGDERLVLMTQELVSWFKEQYSGKYGGIRCEEITSGINPWQSTRCAEIVAAVYQKVKELLVENGFDLYELP